MLKARMDIPWSEDLKDNGYLRVLTVHAEKPSPTVTENSDAKPRLRLDLASNIFEPGDIVNGSLTLLETGDFRSVRVQIMLAEESTAQGLIMEDSKLQKRSVTVTSLIRREDLPLNTTVPFQLPIPQQAPSDYRGAISSIAYYVEAVIDVPYLEDVHLYAPILVGLKPKPPTTTIMPQLVAEQAQSDPEQTPPPAIAVTPGSTLTTSGSRESDAKLDSAPPGTDANTDPETTIIQILSDGGSKDLIEISTELQMRNKGFFDLNQVKKACEGLVSKGRLRRTAEGDYFAKYALNPPE